jgi:hypothetical protein
MKMFDVSEVNTPHKHKDCRYNSKFFDTEFGSHKGIKFDGDGHNWFYLHGNLALSYNYMCFVIQEELSKGSSFQNDDFIFDAD